MSAFISALLGSGLSISGALLLAYFCRHLIIPYLFKNYEHYNSKELEKLKSLLNKDQDLHAFINETVIATVSQKDSDTKKRQILAIDSIWKIFTALKKCSPAPITLDRFNLQTLIKKIAEPKVKDFISLLPDIKNINEIKKTNDYINAEAAQPWVSEEAWALFSLYDNIICYGATQVTLLKSGNEIDYFFDKSVLQTQLEKYFLDQSKIGNQTLSTYLDDIEKQLLVALKNSFLDIKYTPQNQNLARDAVKLASELKNNMAQKIPQEILIE